MAIGTALTKAGAIVLAKAIGGKALKLTRAAFGDAIKNGSRVVPTDSQRDNLTALIHETMSLDINSYEIKGSDIVVSVHVTNEGVAESFKIAEGGIFAIDPTTNQEVLYSYFYDGEDGDRMPAGTTSIVLDYLYELTTTIANAANVSVTVVKEASDFVVYPGVGLKNNQDTFDVDLTAASIPANNASLRGVVQFDSIKGNPIFIGATASETYKGVIKVGKGLYMTGDSLNASASASGGDTSEFDSRLKQMEINQANLYLLLESKLDYDLGSRANLMLAENYAASVDSTSEYEANVYSMASKTNLRVDDTGVLQQGAYYVVSNGLLDYEEVQINAVARGGDYDYDYLLTLNDSLSSAYAKANSKLYRTTATVKDGKAYGAGLIRTKVESRNQTWKGATASEPTTLESYCMNTGDSTITGDGYFYQATIEGGGTRKYFTLDD